MSKHEKKITPAKENEAEFEARVETAILTLRNENGGKLPTNAELNEIVKSSYRRLCPVRRKIVDRLQTVDTRLAQMPEIPEELRLANEEALKALWAKTRDLQNAEIVDLKRVMRAREEEHMRSVEDIEGVVGRLEDDLFEATQGAEASKKIVTELRDELEETQSRLADADARLAERDDLMQLLRGIAPSGTGAKETTDAKSHSRGKKDSDAPELPLK